MTQFISSIKPAEKGTAVVTLAFTDEDGSTVVPTSLAYQLMKSDGTVINNRTFALSTFTGTEIVLSGDDLAMYGSSDSGFRILSVQGVYDSTAGSDLPLKEECKFVIDQLVGQEDES
jgi:hypothetical protein